MEIVENRRARLSGPFLSPGDNFSKRYDENHIWSERECVCTQQGPHGPPRGPPRRIWFSDHQQFCMTSLFSSYFFEKLSPGLKNGPESCPLRFSTISTKNHLLKLNIDKIMAIRVLKCPFLVTLPCTMEGRCEY